LKNLLIYLSETNNDQEWDIYIKDGNINWELITVNGQSQGGGMSVFIAKRYKVNRVITFSGGWDYSVRTKDKNNIIAQWYYNESATPAERYYGTYHMEENTARFMLASYQAMKIPEDHIYALDKDVREGKRAHGEAIRNTIYKELWIEILGSGKLE
jgi:esterase/lipase